MKILIQSNTRLGDIIRGFPLAAHLAKNPKDHVSIECHAKYASILKLVDYAAWKDPADSYKDAAGKPLFEMVYPAAIWPAWAYRYRTENPAKKWLDFVTDQHGTDFRGLSRAIVFTNLPPLAPILKKYNLPAKFSLACPCGFQESIPGDRPRSLTEIPFDLIDSWVCFQMRPRGDFFYLTPPGFRPNRRCVCVDDLAELATLIRNAIDFGTILSAPAVIASARFEKKPIRESWHYIAPINTRERDQDDIATKEQTRWEVNYNAATPRIVLSKS